MTDSHTALLPDHADVAIVGGGMVGLSLALLLQSVAPGLSVVVVDALPAPAEGNELVRPSFDARSTALSASSRVLLEHMGVWDGLAPGLASLSHIQVSDRGNPGLVRLDADDQGLEALGYVVENRVLGHCLHRRLQSTAARLVAPARIDRIEAVADGMILHAGTRQCRAGLAVVAGGGGTDLLAQLGIHTRVRDYRQCALVTNVALAEPHRGRAYERFTDRGPIALLPLPPADNRHRAALVWTLPVDDAQRLLAVDETAFLDELHDGFGYRAGRIVGCGERHSYPLSLAVSEEQVRRHLVVAGNAAHYLHPVAGQGFNLAMRDMGRLAEVIAAAVRAGQAPGELAVLEAYLEAQASDQRNTILFSDGLPRLFSRRGLIPAMLRNTGLITTDLLPPLRRGFGAFGTGMAGRAVNPGVAS